MSRTLRNIFLIIGVLGLVIAGIIFVVIIINVGNIIEGVDDIFDIFTLIAEIPITIAFGVYMMIICFIIAIVSFIIAFILSFFPDNDEKKVSIEDQAMIDTCNAKYNNKNKCTDAIRRYGKEWKKDFEIKKD